MISIRSSKKENHINYIKIEGHANYAEEGFDIVCASVSAIAITTVNCLIRFDSSAIVYTENDGLLEIGILKFNDINDVLIDNMLSMFEELEKQYSDYIEIK